jgi:hypothetical protein
MTARKTQICFNTVRVLRASQSLLDAEQQQQVQEFEAVVAAYEEVHPC